MVIESAVSAPSAGSPGKVPRWSSIPLSSRGVHTAPLAPHSSITHGIPDGLRYCRSGHLEDGSSVIECVSAEQTASA
ncbi:hypothetical protein D8S78_03520 [Natrialba swarupiae]|nr:hypothetical protein [Natrialba swarupiae]